MDGRDSIVHNRFVVPDWGSLYLDVHVPIPSELNDLGNNIEIFLESADGKTSVPLKNNEIPEILLNRIPDNINPAPIQENVAVDLREVDPAFLTSDLKYEQPFMQTQVNRIGYGSYGFETFKLDIPDSWRGTSAKLKIVRSGDKDKTVYIDNLSFRNDNLAFGNPSDARTKSELAENYLVEKTQYASSYNDALKTPNWVSYKLDNTWINPSNPTNERANWATDYSLPFIDKVEEDEGGIVRERNFKDIKGFVRGHQTPEQDRSRVVSSYHPDPITNSKYEIRRDDHQTFLMTNVLPEASQITAWGTLETDLNSFIKNSDIPREAYIVSGRDEEGDRVITSQPRTSGDGSTYTFDINIPDEVWKVVLIPERAGQGPLEVTEGAIAFGVLMNNISHGKETRWRDPDSGVSQTFSINEIESLTGLDFFSEIPDELEEQLESRDDSSRINSANLLASSFIDHGSFDIDSIGQSYLPKESLFISETSSDINFREVNQKNSGKFEIDIAEISPVNSTLAHSNTVHVRPSKVGTEITTSQHIRSSQIGRAQARQSQTTSSQHSTDSDNLIQISLPQTSVTQNSSAQDSSAQIGFHQISPMQIGTTEINSSEVSTSKIDSAPSTFDIADKFDSGEIPFSSSIPAQQLINSHFNHTDDSSFTNLYSTAQTLWNTPTQLDIDFQITNLPTGQLAEATITGFGDSGKPNAGTILIDHDANGVGWFIDETPLNNSEFTAQDTDNFLLASAESEANDKYDLLTTVLHELSHLYGFIDGYKGFDENVATKNGTTKFIGDDFTATLDGEHLDKSAHPYDLLNTHLAPGMRKLPSELDVEILQALIATEFEKNGSKPAGEELLAKLTSDPLLAISNGSEVSRIRLPIALPGIHAEIATSKTLKQSSRKTPHSKATSPKPSQSQKPPKPFSLNWLRQN
jgi:large repetitive protein